MKIIKEEKGQISAELILVLSAMSIIILITAHYATNVLNQISNHTQEVIDIGREKVLSRL